MFMEPWIQAIIIAANLFSIALNGSIWFKDGDKVCLFFAVVSSLIVGLFVAY